MLILRGWLHDSAPATLVVTTRPRKGVTLRAETRRLGAPADEAASEVENTIRSLTLLEA